MSDRTLQLRIPNLHLSFAGVVFLIGVFVKHFYLRESGSVQISDAIIMLAFALTMLSGRVRLQRIDRPLLGFVLCTFLINFLYFLYYGEGFLLSSVYFLYNLFVVMAFRVLTQNDGFLRAMSLVLKAALLTQLGVYLTGTGRMYAGSRYMGTFNDPNQFGFYTTAAFFLLYLIATYRNVRLNPFWFFLLGFFVIVSASTGMTLAYAVFLFFAVIRPFLANKNAAFRYIFLIAFAGATAVFLAFGDRLLLLARTSSWKSLAFIVRRLTEKTEKVSGESGLYGFLRDRQLIRVIREPWYFIYGSGEGNYRRFLESTGQSGEMHSTMLSMCYYYGILPYSLFLKWLKDNFTGVSAASVSVFAALIIEAFTLANHRQPLFWMIYAMGSLLAEHGKQENEHEHEIQHHRTDLQGARLS